MDTCAIASRNKRADKYENFMTKGLPLLFFRRIVVVRAVAKSVVLAELALVGSSSIPSATGGYS
jgi:hypothetical protein